MTTIEEHVQEAMVTMSLGDLVRAGDEMTRVEGERDRARQLAAHLEEIVAMRTTLVRSFVEWYRADQGTELRIESLVAWAEAQLDEVP